MEEGLDPLICIRHWTRDPANAHPNSRTGASLYAPEKSLKSHKIGIIINIINSIKIEKVTHRESAEMCFDGWRRVTGDEITDRTFDEQMQRRRDAKACCGPISPPRSRRQFQARCRLRTRLRRWPGRPRRRRSLRERPCGRRPVSRPFRGKPFRGRDIR